MTLQAFGRVPQWERFPFHRIRIFKTSSRLYNKIFIEMQIIIKKKKKEK